MISRYKSIILVALLTLTACDAGIPESSTTTPGGYSVTRLFTQDECTVYRFFDMGRYRYFTNCGGSTYTQTDGKTTTDNGVMGR